MYEGGNEEGGARASYWPHPIDQGMPAGDEWLWHWWL